jgi:hypothetical protein
MKNGFRAVLEGPASGWLTVTLEAPAQRYQFWPSHVPDDSVSLLAAGLLTMLDGRGAVVPWNDEPAVHQFLFSVSAARATLTVVALRDRAHGEVEREAVFSVSGTVHDVVWPLWRGLRDLQSRVTPEEYHRQWREPFPAAEVAELDRRLQAARSEDHR